MKSRPLTVAFALALGAVLVGQLNAMRPADQAEAAPDPARALIADLIDHAAHHPDDAVARLKLAVLLREAGEHEQADKWLAEAKRIDPGLYETFGKPHEGDGPPPAEGGIAGTQYPVSGPDVIVGVLSGVQLWGRVGNISAYSVGTTSCNAGDTPLLWHQNTQNHPVIAQHMYRYKNGRFEQIGQSWVKHGFSVVSGSECQNQFGYPCSGHNSTQLNPGCSDPYGTGLNGSYTWLGPKHEINAFTGVFPYPYGSYPNNGPIGKRLQVHDNYLKPELNVGAVYYVEGHYIAKDDAAAGNAFNNASYRRVAVVESQPFVFSVGFVAGHPTVRELPAIYAWQTHNPQVSIKPVDIPNEGRFHIGHLVTDNGDGTWNYEFAVHNLNSNSSGGSFSLPIPEGVTITNIGFHDVAWHSGAPYSNDPWDVTLENGMLTWATEPITVNPNANALRWGTLYNFRFDADTPPQQANGILGLFRSAQGVSQVTFAALAPSEPQVPCLPPDFNCSGSVDVFDLLDLLANWGPCADCGNCPHDLTDDCAVDVFDLLDLLANWG